MRYHMREDGTPGECSATQMDCPLGGVEHGNFSSKAEAQAWAEEVNLQRAGGSMFSTPERKPVTDATVASQRIDGRQLREWIRAKDPKHVEIYGIDTTERGNGLKPIGDHPRLYDVASDGDEARTILSQAGGDLEDREGGAYDPETDPGMVYTIVDIPDFYETLNDEDASGAERGRAAIERLRKDGPALGIHVVLLEENTNKPSYPTETVRSITLSKDPEKRRRLVEENGSPRFVSMEALSKSPSFERIGGTNALTPKGHGRFFRGDGREVLYIEHAPGDIQSAIHYVEEGVEPDLISSDIPQDLFYVR